MLPRTLPQAEILTKVFHAMTLVQPSSQAAPTHTGSSTAWPSSTVVPMASGAKPLFPTLRTSTAVMCTMKHRKHCAGEKGNRGLWEKGSRLLDRP